MLLAAPVLKTMRLPHWDHWLTGRLTMRCTIAKSRRMPLMSVTWQSLARLKDLGLGGSLLLLDRWYPSKHFIVQTLDAGFSFVMRVRRKWNRDVDAVDGDGWVSLCHDGCTLRIPVIKVALSNGEFETSRTNLTEELLPFAEAGELYFKRWGIETAYDTLKSKLQLENFSSKTEVGVKQDFYATVYLMGFAEICAADATRSIETADQGKNLP